MDSDFIISSAVLSSGTRKPWRGRPRAGPRPSPPGRGWRSPRSQAALEGRRSPPGRPGEAEGLRNAECHVAQNRTQQLLSVGLGIRSREVGGHSLSLVSGPPARKPLAAADSAVGGGPSRSHLHLPPSSETLPRDSVPGAGAETARSPGPFCSGQVLPGEAGGRCLAGGKAFTFP